MFHLSIALVVEIDRLDRWGEARIKTTARLDSRRRKLRFGDIITRTGLARAHLSSHNSRDRKYFHLEQDEQYFDVRRRLDYPRMVRPQYLAKCVRQTLVQARAFSISSQLQASTPSSIANLLERPPTNAENITVNGFVRSIRNQKTRSFASIGDGSSLQPLQALLTPEQAQRSACYASTSVTYP
jgi:hypothetical protein